MSVFEGVLQGVLESAREGVLDASERALQFLSVVVHRGFASHLL